MPISSAEPTMPPGMEAFPWKHLLHMWDYDYLRRGGVRLRLWYQPSAALMDGPAEAYAREAFSTHCAIWCWLTERGFELTTVPKFEADGNGFRDKDTGKQEYRSVAFFGEFSLIPKEAS